MNEALSQIFFFANACWRRRWFALAIAWVMCAGGWYGITLVPDSYTSSGRIYVDTNSVLQPLLRGLAVDVGNDVATHLQTLQGTFLSQTNLAKVARVIAPNSDQATDADLEPVVEELRQKTSISGGLNNLFTISYEGPDPQEARDIVQILMTIFIETNVGVDRSEIDKARDFIDDRIAAYEAQLEEAEAQAARFKQENRDLLPGVAGYHGRLQRVQDELELVKTQLQEALTQKEILLRELADVPEFLEFESNEALTGLGPPTDSESRIVETEFRLQELLSTYTEQHPDVLTLKRRLKALYDERDQEMEAALAADPLIDGDDGLASAPKYRTYNPLHSQLRVRLVEQEARVALLTERVRQKASELQEVDGLASMVPMIEAEHAKLNRDYQVLQGKYQELLARREVVRMSHEREVQRAERLKFRVVEAPQVPLSPSGPNRPLLLAGVTLGALAAAIGLVLGLALLDTTYSDPDRLSKEFDIPNMGAITLASGGGKRALAVAGQAMFAVLTVAIFCAAGGLFYLDQQVGLANVELADLLTGQLELRGGALPYSATESLANSTETRL